MHTQKQLALILFALTANLPLFPMELETAKSAIADGKPEARPEPYIVDSSKEFVIFNYFVGKSDKRRFRFLINRKKEGAPAIIAQYVELFEDTLKSCLYNTWGVTYLYRQKDFYVFNNNEKMGAYKLTTAQPLIEKIADSTGRIDSPIHPARLSMPNEKKLVLLCYKGAYVFDIQQDTLLNSVELTEPVDHALSFAQSDTLVLFKNPKTETMPGTLQTYPKDRKSRKFTKKSPCGRSDVWYTSMHATKNTCIYGTDNALFIFSENAAAPLEVTIWNTDPTSGREINSCCINKDMINMLYRKPLVQLPAKKKKNNTSKNTSENGPGESLAKLVQEEKLFCVAFSFDGETASSIFSTIEFPYGVDSAKREDATLIALHSGLKFLSIDQPA